MIRAPTMNNLTLIILVSFSVINILYMGSDLFTRKSKNPSTKFGEHTEEAPEQPDCKKCNEFLSCQSQKNEKIVRKTKTSTKSKILGNGDLVEQTTVTEVTETVTHTGHVEEDNGDCFGEAEATSSYHDCLETCEAKRTGKEKEQKEKDKWRETPVVPFGCKPSGFLDNIDETIEVQNPSDLNQKVEQKKVSEQSIPNSTAVNESSELYRESSTTNENLDTSEKHYEDKQAPPNIQLPTGLPCCLSRMVSSAIRSWTFYLSGLIMDIPLYCTDRCLYTRANDSNSYCFSTDKSTSCTTNITALMRLHPYNFRVELDDLKTREEVIADSKSAPVIKLNNKKKPDATSCCPVKQVVGEESSSGLFVLRGKTPDRRDHCSDNCIYMKVGDVKQTKYCFGIGNLGTACHQKVPSISILLNTNTTLREMPLRLDDVETKSKKKNLNSNIQKTKDEENLHNVEEKKMDIKIVEKKQDTKVKSKEVLIPLLLKNEPVKLIEDEIPVAIQNLNEKDKEDKRIKDKEEKENEKNKVLIYNGIRIRKMPKKENVEKKTINEAINSTPSIENKKQINVDKSYDNKKENVSLSFEQNKTEAIETKEKIFNKSELDNPNEETTVMVCSSKCSAGVPMKLRRIDKKEEPLSIESTKSPVDNEEQFEAPLKINCRMRMPMKLIKIPENLANKNDSEKDKLAKNGTENLDPPARTLTLPVKLKKEIDQKLNDSTKFSSNEMQKISNATNEDVVHDNKTAINGTSAMMSKISNLKNDTKTTTGRYVYKLNKTRTKLPSNETGTKIETKNKCTTLKEMASSEGKRTLPYRITLTERPKLINRKKDSDDSVKAEIPIQIASCTGKPYKLKTVHKKESEPVKIDVELPEPQGFAPVKLLPRDYVMEI